ncbi:RWD-domain-containing protein [Trametes versicolor FP-101664 SS1]|uniref:RWD-domain-containing protein n=1 Tax=Trametes versicolor (strain FP-101664) TaxID=717944 RepID=UPI00046229D1|nr:RWD-domain-containing protein [Trametes versicolor FP-101664 SS1]EIW60479.1 RWD-domain-containing protein [Trametes versicolor FP-101664 SS1]
MSAEVLAEEFEVLESIYPEELTKLSEREIRIEVEPDDPVDGIEPLTITLDVEYTDEYPDVLPTFTLDSTQGELEEAELTHLHDELQRVGEENLGMAMTFTLVTHLRERLSAIMREREERDRHEAAEKERKALEAEEARTRGTPVTVESFKAWKIKFDKELAVKRAREDEERLKGWSAKEREEYRKALTRLSGRQLFERDQNLAALDEDVDEEGVSVDISQYDRNAREEEEENEDIVTFSDSD